MSSSEAAERVSGDETPPLAEQDLTAQISDIGSRPVQYGGMSDIYQATWNGPDGAIMVAVKVIRTLGKVDDGALRRYNREIALWKRISHVNLLPLLGLCSWHSSLPAAIAPWCRNGDINTYVKAQLSKAMPQLDGEMFKLELLAQTADGLSYLHVQGIVHGDLKGANILIADDGTARVADFGFSCMLAEHSQKFSLHTSTMGGTFRWMCPTLLRSTKARPSEWSDVWSFGCVILEVWSGLVPYYDVATEQGVIIALSRERLPSRPQGFPHMIWQACRTCWDIQLDGEDPIPNMKSCELPMFLRMLRSVTYIDKVAHVLLEAVQQQEENKDDDVPNAAKIELQKCVERIGKTRAEFLTGLTSLSLPLRYLDPEMALLSLLRATGIMARTGATHKLDETILAISQALDSIPVKTERLSIPEAQHIAALFSPDLKDKIMRAISTSTPRTLSFGFHKGRVAFIPRTTRLLAASLSAEGNSLELVIWDFLIDREVSRWSASADIETASGLAVDAVVVSPGGQYALTTITSTAVQTTHVWHLETQREIGAREALGVRPVDDKYLALALSWDGSSIAAVPSARDSLHVTRIASGQTKVLQGFTPDVVGDEIAFSPDGSYIAVSLVHCFSPAFYWDMEAEEATMLDWDLDERKQTTVAFSPDSKRVFVASSQGEVWSWDVATGVTLVVHPRPFRDDCLYTPDQFFRLPHDASRLVARRAGFIVWDLSTCTTTFLAGALRNSDEWSNDWDYTVSPDGRHVLVLDSNQARHTISIAAPEVWDISGDWIASTA